MASLATKLFGIPEEIIGGNLCPSHLYRWTIFGNDHFKVCLQHTVGDDGTGFVCHDPMQFVSVGVAQDISRPSTAAGGVLPSREAWTVLIRKKATD